MCRTSWPGAFSGVALRGSALMGQAGWHLSLTARTCMWQRHRSLIGKAPRPGILGHRERCPFLSSSHRGCLSPHPLSVLRSSRLSSGHGSMWCGGGRELGRQRFFRSAFLSSICSSLNLNFYVEVLSLRPSSSSVLFDNFVFLIPLSLLLSSNLFILHKYFVQFHNLSSNLFVLHENLVQFHKYYLSTHSVHPLQDMCMFAFLPFKVGRIFGSHLVSSLLSRCREWGLGGKLMSEGLRVGVYFCLPHDQ